MNENYIVINGKKIELTEEQLKQLGIEPEKKRKNPFKRVKGKEYYCIDDEEICMYRDYGNSNDKSSYKQANYFNDEAFAKQVALHQLLHRKLLKFAYDNECEDTAEWNCMLNPTYDSTCENTVEWSKRKQHYSVRYSYEDSAFIVFCQYDYKDQAVYFSSKEAAKRAINEVVEPFMKEHPDFVW